MPTDSASFLQKANGKAPSWSTNMTYAVQDSMSTTQTSFPTCKFIGLGLFAMESLWKGVKNGERWGHDSKKILNWCWLLAFSLLTLDEFKPRGFKFDPTAATRSLEQAKLFSLRRVCYIYLSSLLLYLVHRGVTFRIVKYAKLTSKGNILNLRIGEYPHLSQLERNSERIYSLPVYLS